MKTMRLLVSASVLMTIVMSGSTGKAIELEPIAVQIIAPDSLEQDPQLGPRVLLRFDLSDLQVAGMVSFAEITMPIFLRTIVGDSLVRFDTFLLGSDWTEEATWDAPWLIPGGDIDSTFFTSYTIKCERADTLHIDVTQHVRYWLNDPDQNYGLIVILRHPNFISYGNFGYRVRNLRSFLKLSIEAPGL